MAKTSENTLITLMNQTPKDIELSSLPMFKDSKPLVELSLSGYDDHLIKKYFEMYKNELEEREIEYTILNT